MKKLMLLSIVLVLFSCGGNSDYASSEKKEMAEHKAEVSPATMTSSSYEEAESDDVSEALNGTVSNKIDSKISQKKVVGEVEADDLKTPEFADARIIKTANIKFKVLDVDQSTRDVQKIIKTKGAYISDMNQSKNRNHFYSEITIRVPNLYFEDVLNQLALSGEKVDYKRITSQDVTEEYVDIKTRLKTKKEVKKRYEEILRSKAKTVSEVLETEEKLRRIQEEIESQEGRLRYLHNQTNMSTIFLTIYEDGVNIAEIKHPEEFKERASGGFAAGWSAILDVIVALTYLWPGILITLFILIWKRKLIFRIRNSFKKTFSTSEENPK